ncbi:MAG: response regulator transcription factor [Actinomycetota bacterium]|nr:response regulator transcription factor [Actinomycetota bacterium]
MPKVLVVDDDPAIRRVLQTTLELDGYEVSMAADGEEALATVSGSIPDLVILDVMMPRMDGFDVLAKLRESQETAKVPVILLTARSSAEDQWEGWQKGVDYYMTKPFDVEELLRFMDYVFKGGGPNAAPPQE